MCLCHEQRPGVDSGYPAAEDRRDQSHADAGGDGDAADQDAGKYTASGGSPSDHDGYGSTAKKEDLSHLNQFYKPYREVKDEKFDGMIITGAPVEKLAFEEVDYWDDLKQLMDDSKKNVFSTIHICWAAQAGPVLIITTSKRRC